MAGVGRGARKAVGSDLVQVEVEVSQTQCHLCQQKLATAKLVRSHLQNWSSSSQQPWKSFNCLLLTVGTADNLPGWETAKDNLESKRQKNRNKSHRFGKLLMSVTFHLTAGLTLRPIEEWKQTWSHFSRVSSTFAIAWNPIWICCMQFPSRRLHPAHFENWRDNRSTLLQFPLAQYIVKPWVTLIWCVIAQATFCQHTEVIVFVRCTRPLLSWY